jgi:hypothetical protein
MARPIKETVDYFPHYTNGGKTLFIIDSMFGNDGYAFWFRLLELLCNQKGLVYDVRNPVNMKFLTAKTRVSEDYAIKILDTLAELDAIDPELWAQKLIWATNLADNVRDAFKNRISRMPKKPVIEGRNPQTTEFPTQKPPNNGVSSPENGERKEKKSKEKKSKEKESSVSDAETLSLDSQTIDLCNYFETLKPGQTIIAHTAALKIMIDTYPYSWVKEALEITIKKKSKFIQSYMEKILQNWTAEGKEESHGADRNCDKPVFGDSEVQYDFNRPYTGPEHSDEEISQY